MEFAGSSSWRIEVEEPQILVIALFVRDAAGLRPEVNPVIPPLEPRVEQEASGGEDAVAAAQWANWWLQLLDHGAAGLRDLEPPDFPGLGERPELRHLLRIHFDDAATWSNDRTRDYADLEGPHVEGEVVREAERAVGRRSRPFRLRITELPVAGGRGWVPTDDHVIVARSFRDDSEAYRQWLRPVVDRLV